jgi:hypothetical protein
MEADALANSIKDKDYFKFWSRIRKYNNGKSTKYATTVGGCTGDSEITEMWQQHFDNLYNSVNDDEAKKMFYSRIDKMEVNYKQQCISICDISTACGRQKLGKAVGLDGVAMEALIHGGARVHIHICFLFNLFIKYGYVPKSFTQCVIIPLVKCKTGDMSDVNNYRAISIATAMSKLFECLISDMLPSVNENDDYQFAFKRGNSTSMCTNVFKQTVDYYTRRGSHVFTCFIDFAKAFDTVSYWKLFLKLLDDNIDKKIVTLLAYWYSNQEVCVRWQGIVSLLFLN